MTAACLLRHGPGARSCGCGLWRMFHQGINPVQVTRRPRVRAKPAYQWRRR